MNNFYIMYIHIDTYYSQRRIFSLENKLLHSVHEMSKKETKERTMELIFHST